ncbi:MAG: glycyl-radical enzyme activating protein [Eubacteriales bacterium]|nr:glycyl-radical enzyme activating protein [Eubacteriales bacterium]
MSKGVVFNIQHFSVHDGPGIRTTVFLKGCPLHCAWCANPESQRFDIELGWTKKECIGCKCCENLTCASCRLTEQGVVWKEQGQIDGKEVKKVCPTGALHPMGELRSAEEVFREVQKDQVFYKNSEGGLTISGGEPLSQPEFTEELLTLAGEHGIHRAIETTNYTSWKILESIASKVDFYITDVKCFSEDLHKQQTGVSNQRILENLVRLRNTFPNLPILVRTPVVPGFNDNEEELQKIGEFLNTLQPENTSWELLKYHRLGAAKYDSMHREYSLGSLELTEERFRELQKKAAEHTRVTFVTA